MGYPNILCNKTSYNHTREKKVSIRLSVLNSIEISAYRIIINLSELEQPVLT